MSAARSLAAGERQRPLRALHLVNWLNPGGVETWLLRLAEYLHAEGVQPFAVLCKGRHEGSLAARFRSLGVSVTHAPLGLSHQTFARGVREVSREQGLDLVHNHLGSWAGAGVWAARRAGLPVLTTFHSTGFAAQDHAFRRPWLGGLRAVYVKCSVAHALARSSLVTAVSKALLGQLGLPEDDAFLHRLCVPAPSTSATEARERLRAELGLTPAAEVLIHVGSFRPAKDHHQLVLCFRELLRLRPQARLLLAGSGALEAQIRELCATQQVQDSVHFLGHVPRVADLLPVADLMVLTSRYEGFPMVLLEGAAAGLPSVVMKIPGIDEAVTSGQTGLVVASRDPATFAQAIEGLLQRPEQRATLGARARERVLGQFTPAPTWARLQGQYRRACALGQAPL